MIANVVRSMGVHLGDNLRHNLEDKDFNWDALNKSKRGDREQMLSSIREAIVKRKAERDVWGWKYPRIHRYFDDILPEVVNPVLVCVFRDAVASSWRRVVKNQESPLTVIRKTLDTQANDLSMIEKSNVPALLISYEKAIANPLQLAKSLSEFMSLGLADEQLVECAKRVNPELGYRASNL